MRSLPPAALAALVALAGCQLVFDAEPPFIPVDAVGDRPPPAALRVATAAGADSLRFVRGPTPDDPWVALYRAPKDGSAPSAVRLVRLRPPFDEERHAADRVYIRRSALYLVYQKDGPAPACAASACLVVHTPGVGLDDVFAVPRGGEYVLDAPADVGFLYFVSGADQLLLQRRDRGFSRTLRARVDDTGARAALLGGPAFDQAGARLVHRSDTCQPPGQALRPPGPCLGAVAVHETTAARDWLLTDVRAGDAVVLDAARDALVSCGLRGVRSVPLDPALPTRVLDGEPGCTPLGTVDTTAVQRSAAWVSADFAYYAHTFPRGGDGGAIPDGGAGPARVELRAVPLDGRAPPRALPVPDDAERVLLFRGLDPPAWSRDPGGRYAGDAGDGWVAGVRFMERGRAVTASQDGARLRFLEHAATFNAAGELRSVPLDPGGAPRPDAVSRLAPNVTDYHELPDGRLVAAADQPYDGPHNRVLLLDEAARTARVLCAGTPSYYRIPGSTDILAVKQNADDTYDLLRVAIPPP